MLNIGHRGAMGHAPENTLESIQIALDMGVDWMEIDVYFIEGELVVIHDDDLDRTTNGTGAVIDQTLAHLRSLDAGNGQQIPLLSEVVGLIAGRVGLNIELKGPGTAGPVIEYLENHLSDEWKTDQILLSAFDHQELADAKAINPKYKRAPLYWQGEIDYDFVVNELEAVSINPSLRMVTKEMVDEAHGHGLSVFVYTVNESADIERMRKIGVDGIFTNYPDRV
ncbi:MAG: glycerophosphoryl diester phosphodiesterase [Cellvibrionaceae bacterium]|jgi:glycerophosphoryl diester phosphodiesterase